MYHLILGLLDHPLELDYETNFTKEWAMLSYLTL